MARQLCAVVACAKIVAIWWPATELWQGEVSSNLNCGQKNRWWNGHSIPKRQRCSHWSFGMDRQFRRTLYCILHATKQLYELPLSTCLSFWLSVWKFQKKITISNSNVRAKGQGQRSKFSSTGVEGVPYCFQGNAVNHTYKNLQFGRFQKGSSNYNWLFPQLAGRLSKG